MADDRADMKLASQEAPAAHGALTTIRLPHNRIERRAIAWWIARALIYWGTPFAALCVAATVWEPARIWLLAPIIALALVLTAKVCVEPFWRFRTHRWEITEHASYAVSGWLVREWRVAPSSRIQTVDAVRGPLEQVLRLATLRVTTASSYGAIKISGLDATAAAAAATQLALVAEIAEGDAT